MSITLETKINPRYKTCDITSFHYAGFEEDVQYPVVSHGCLMPSGPGFPFRLEKPQLSFKTYRAIAEKGLKGLADRCIGQRARSHITPDNVWAGVLKYGSKPVTANRDTLYLQCLQKLRDQMRCSVTPLTMEEAVRTVPQTTSPGLPFIRTHPGIKKGEVFDRYCEKFSRYWTRIGEKKPSFPLPDCAAFARSHISSVGDNKVRPVWAYPSIVIAEEARYATPILDKLKSQEIGTHFAYGMEMLKGGMTWLHNSLQRTRRRDPGAKFLMLDFSAFDSSVPAWMIRDMFAIIEEQFNLSDSDKLRFKTMVNYFINTPIQNMDGRRFQKWHGVPSGSMFTNIIDTMINYVVSLYLIKSTTGEDPLFINCFGDDFVASVPGSSLLNMNSVATAARVMFGMTVNIKKSYWTNVITNVHYLGYYNCFGDPVKPDEELIGSMLYPQYMKDDWAYCLARALGCLLASCGNSSNVFIAAQGVYWKAHREASVNVDRGLDLIRSTPRMLRHLSNMGCAEWNLSPEYFFRRDYSYPRLDCTKILRGIV